MPRVSEETIKKLDDFINSLPQEARSKCALCSETLTHIVKMAEVQTGAGTATVARVLSEKINENAAPVDMEALNAVALMALNPQARGGKSAYENLTADQIKERMAI